MDYDSKPFSSSLSFPVYKGRKGLVRVGRNTNIRTQIKHHRNPANHTWNSLNSK